MDCSSTKGGFERLAGLRPPCKTFSLLLLEFEDGCRQGELDGPENVEETIFLGAKWKVEAVEAVGCPGGGGSNPGSCGRPFSEGEACLGCNVVRCGHILKQ